MADFDYEAAYQASLGAGAAIPMPVPTPTPAPISIPTLQAVTAQPSGFDYEAAYQASLPRSDLAAIRNAAVKGITGTGALAEELLPSINANTNNETGAVIGRALFGAPGAFIGQHLTPPHLFGRFGTEAQFPKAADTLARQYGVLDNSIPATEYGKYASDVSENAAAAAPFGPWAMLASGLLGGSGSYLGEKVGGPTGKTVGNIAFSLSPTALTKLGVMKEIGEHLGPTLSQLPILRRVLGLGPVETAVGRAIEKQATDLPAFKEALAKENAFIGPKTELDALKTVDQLIPNAGISRVTDAVENAIPNAGFRAINEEQAAVTARAATKGHDPQLTGYDVSKEVEQKLINADESLRAVENATWGAIPKNDLVDTRLGALDNTLAAKVEDITVGGALPLEGEGKALLSQFHTAQKATDEGIVNFDVIQKLRERALKLGRATSSRLSAQDRQANDVANAVEEHLRHIVDVNADAGKLTDQTVELWKGARTLTKERIQTAAAPKPGVANEGTKGLEDLLIKKLPPADDKLLREGLNSPDKMYSHIRAAKKGGEDIRPQYKQALQSELAGVPQSKWADIIDRKRKQWELVHSPDEMRAIDQSLADIASREATEAARIGVKNSATAKRLTDIRKIFGGKGVANIDPTFQGVPSVLLGIEGFRQGWQSSDTTAGGLAKGTIGAILGATAGKKLLNAKVAASEAFDTLAIQALKDPKVMQRVLEAAKPSQFGQNVQKALMQSAITSSSKTAGQLVGSKLKAEVVSKSAIPAEQQRQETAPAAKEMPKEAEPVELPPMPTQLNNLSKEERIKKTAAFVDSQPPLIKAIIKAESSGDPFNQSPTGPLGLMQLTRATAKAYGAKERLDPKQNVKAGTAFVNDLIEKYDDPKVVLASFNQGESKIDAAIRKAKSTKWEDIKHFLTEEGRKYPDRVLKHLEA